MPRARWRRGDESQTESSKGENPKRFRDSSRRHLPRRSRHGQWSVKNGQADDFGFGDVRAVWHAFGREEEGAVLIYAAGFIPFAGEDIGPFVGQWMRVRGDGVAGFEFAEHNHAAGAFVFMQNF